MSKNKPQNPTKLFSARLWPTMAPSGDWPAVILRLTLKVTWLKLDSLELSPKAYNTYKNAFSWIMRISHISIIHIYIFLYHILPLHQHVLAFQSFHSPRCKIPYFVYKIFVINVSHSFIKSKLKMKSFLDFPVNETHTVFRIPFRFKNIFSVLCAFKNITAHNCR